MSENNSIKRKIKRVTRPITKFYRRHRILCTLFFISALSVFLGWFAFVFMDIWTNHGATVEVPDLRNMRYDEAQKTLAACDLTIEISDSVYDESMAPGTVIETWPRPGAVIKPGREVFVTITSFEPQKIEITSSLSGVSSRQAQSYLEALGIKNIRIVNVPSQYPDLVVGAKCDGREIHPGQKISITSTVTLEVGSLSMFNELPQPADTTAIETPLEPEIETPPAVDPDDDIIIEDYDSDDVIYVDDDDDTQSQPGYYD